MRFLEGIAASLVLLFLGSCAAQEESQHFAALHHEVAQLRELILRGMQEEHTRRLLPAGLVPNSGKIVTQAYTDDSMDILKKQTTSDVVNMKVALDSIWLILCAAIVFQMHVGFAMYESGACRQKNAQNVLLSVMVNVTLGTIAWWIFGWAIAYGGPYQADGQLGGGGVAGSKEFAGGGFLKEDSDGNMVGFKPDANGNPTQSKMLLWFFKWAVCTNVGSIVSGGVASRVTTYAFALYATLMAAFIWPLVVAWTWGNGWMAQIGGVGYTDFAGSGIVHIIGGVGALVGSVILGPRIGRFDESKQHDFYPHSLPLVVFGAFCIWFGFYGFACGSTLGLSDAAKGALAAQVAVNISISASTSAIVVFVFRFTYTSMQYKHGIYDVKGMCHGIVAGLVSISAGCANVENGSALVIGLIGGFVYEGASRLLRYNEIDDPVDASAVHGACGIWGVLAAALFDWGKGFDHFHGRQGFHCITGSGTSCRDNINGTGLGVNIAMIIVTCLWSGILSGTIFWILRKAQILRIDPETEDMGVDKKRHSPGRAYDWRARPGLAKPPDERLQGKNV